MYSKKSVLLAVQKQMRCFKRKLSGGKTKITTAQVDADDVNQLINLINEFKPDVVINLALPYQDLTIMDACLATKVHYVDTANYEPLDTAKFEYKWQWAYRERFEKAGITALLGSGFDPGVTGVFSAYAMKHHLMKLTILISWIVMQVIMVIHLLQTSILKSISVKFLLMVATGKMVNG